MEMTSSGIRRRMTLALAGTAVLGSSLIGLQGCASPPSRDEIDETYEDWKAKLDEVRAELLAACRADPACDESEIEAWYRSKKQELYDLWLAATQRRWEDAYKRRERLEEELRQLIPSWPDIQDILKPLLPQSSIVTLDVEGTPSDGCGGDDVAADLADAQSTLDGNSFEIAPNPCIVYAAAKDGIVYAKLSGERSYHFAGDYSIDADGTMFTGDMTLDLTLSETVGADGSYAASVVQGTGSIELGPSLVSLSVVADTGNVIEVDSTGQGWVTVLFSTSHSMFEWSSILPKYNRIRLPISRSGETLRLTDQPFAPGDFVPYRPHPSSDYDGDGVLNYTLDFAAFTSGFQAQAPSADINADEVWDQTDIDTWIEWFNEDLAQSDE